MSEATKTIVFEKPVTIGGKVYATLSDNAEGVWYFEETANGMRIITHDTGRYLVPWHAIAWVKSV